MYQCITQNSIQIGNKTIGDQHIKQREIEQNM